MESSFTTPPLTPEESNKVETGSTMDPTQEEIPQEMELQHNEERPKNKSRLETRKKENFESRLENITSLLKLIHKQIDLLRSEHKLNKQEALLAEYKQLLEEALLIGNQCLINALKQRIIILEKAEVFQ